MITRVECLDLISQLGKEYVPSYLAEDETIDAIVDDLLAMQILTPAITKGTISNSIKNLTRSIQVDGDSILRALYRLRDTVGGYIEVDNDRQLNWLDSIGENKGQQIRYRKNLKGIERDIDYSQLFNRIYAYGEGEGTARIKLSDAEGQEEDYIEDTDSQTTWGGIYTRVIVDKSITHPDTLLAWAQLFLDDHKNPPISYRIDAIDLSHSEELDFSFEALQLGSILKVMDVDLGIDVETNIVKIGHPDLLKPQEMTVELSTLTKDITDTLSEIYDRQQFDQHIATNIGAGQVIVKGTFTVLDWVTGGETTIKGDVIETGTVILSALAFTPLTSSGETGEIIATINATAEGIKISASKVDIVAGVNTYKQPGIPTSENIGDIWYDTDDANKAYRAACIGADEIKAGEWEIVRDTQISTNQSAITVNENAISLNVTDISSNEGRITTAEGSIVVNAGAITLEVTNRTNADSTLQGQITVNAGNIVLKVSKNDVINQINISTEGIKIDADNITLDGVVLVTDDIKSSNYSAGSAGWQIKGDGSCELNELTIRGTVAVGQDIRSSNYVAATSGWIIEGGGDAEFNDVIVRGAIHAGVGSVIDFAYVDNGTTADAEAHPDYIRSTYISSVEIKSPEISGNSGYFSNIFKVGSSGIVIDGGNKLIKSSNYSAGSAGWQIENTGDAEFNDVKVRGSIYSSSIVSGNTLTVSGAINAGGGNAIIDNSGIKLYGSTELLKLYYSTTQVGALVALSLAQVMLRSSSELVLRAGNAGSGTYTKPVAIYGKWLQLPYTNSSGNAPSSPIDGALVYDNTDGFMKYYSSHDSQWFRIQRTGGWD